MTELTARAAYDTDWHLYLTCPDRGELGFCTGVGDEPFDPDVATRVLEEAGWRVISPDGWTETSPPEEYPYVTQVARTTA